MQPERLLFRLFNEHGVRVFDAQPVADDCSCSDEKVRTMLEGLTAEQQAESIEDGLIRVDCEFCSKRYQFDPSELSALTAE